MLGVQSSVTKLFVHLRDTSLSLDGCALVVVVGVVRQGKMFDDGSRGGLVVCGAADGRYY